MELEQLEAIALAEDREAALEALIPGTEDWYFYRALHLQLSDRLSEVPAILEQWTKRLGRTARVVEIERRQALLTYEQSPKKTADYLKRELSLSFSHQRELEAEGRKLKSTLDPSSIARETMLQRAKRRSTTALSPFEPSSHVWVGPHLSKTQRRHLLDALARPDVDGLVDWIVEDLEDPGSGGFGSRQVHHRLLIAQLDALAERMPALCTDEAFVLAYAKRLAPPEDADIEHDLDVRAAYLDRLSQLLMPLEPSFNELKVLVLYHQLELGRRRGDYDRGRFLAYLALPRRAGYVPAPFLKKHSKSVASFGVQHAEILLSPVHDDTPLVRAYVEHFVVQDESLDDFAPFVAKRQLVSWRALAMIGAGIGDAERWYGELDDPSAFQAYKDRVDIELSVTNRAVYAADEPVALQVRVKNVRDLVVKVFEINTKNYFVWKTAEVDTSIDLDGLVAGEERTIRFDEPPVRVVDTTIELESLARPGTFVVELIGNGKSSRALIRKGRLRFVERLGPRGHLLTVIDEDGEVRPNATIWCFGKAYEANDAGEVLIPYTTAPRRQKVLLCDGPLTTVDAFDHRAENYELRAGFYVDPEQLRVRGKAQVVVRAGLYVNGEETSLALLDDVKLRIEASTRTSSSSTEVDGFALAPERESIHEIHVPEGLRRLNFQLRARVRANSTAAWVDLAQDGYVDANQLEGTAHTADLFLTAGRDGYVLSVLGKTGEPIPRSAVDVKLRLRDFTENVDTTLATDDAGRVELGALDGVGWVEARRHSSEGDVTQRFHLPTPVVSSQRTVHALHGDEVRLPYAGAATEASRENFSLLRVNRGTYISDVRDHLTIEPGALVLAGLDVGTYELYEERSGRTTSVRVGAGRSTAGWVVSPTQQLEARPRARASVRAVDVDDTALSVQLNAFSSSTRVHVIGTRFAADNRLHAALRDVSRPEPRAIRTGRSRSRYLSGRDIGDEYRYVLERRYQQKLPGNMMARPGLLLNPWAVRSTEVGIDAAAAGGAYSSMDMEKERAEAKKKRKRDAGRGARSHESSYDFLAHPTAAHWNLTPDEDGVVRVERAALENAAFVRVVVVDRGLVLQIPISLEEPALEARDLRLDRPLDPATPYTQKKERSAIAAGASLVIEDSSTADVESIDTLSKVFGVLQTLSRDEKLPRFSFLTTWPSLDDDEKRAKYSEFACHEVHLFLRHKDPAFFESVIRPYLANKKDKTFLDHYLLDDDLTGYLEPWKYGRLNTLERILLGKRIDPGTKRHVKDRFDLEPPDVASEDRLFRSVLESGSLDKSVSIGKGKAEPPKLMAAMAPPAPAPAQPSRRSAMGGGGPSLDALMDEEVAFDDDLDMFAEAAEEAAFDESELKPLYRGPEATEEWAENNYYERRIHEQDASLIRVNAFWNDFAAHGDGPFLSGNFPAATSCLAEVLCALAVLDLPFSTEDPSVEEDGARSTLSFANNAIVLHREIRPAAPLEEAIPILVSQNYLRMDDREEWDGGTQREKYVRGELLTHVPYVCQVVLTNPTSARERLQLLLQIPEGALPLQNGFFTTGRPVELEPYTAESIEYAFYFPLPGEFVHYPVHVAKEEASVAKADVEPKLTVVDTPSSVDRTSWSWVSQHGTVDAVAEFLDERNVERIDLSRIAWRMDRREDFDRITALLSARHRFDRTLWSYGVFHQAPDRIGELLRHEDYFVSGVGYVLESSLLQKDPVERCDYEHLEYLPLVNARAHRLGENTKILVDAFKQQYQRFLEVLTYRPRPNAADLLAASYYLFLQDRVADALAVFERIDAAEIHTNLQYDYLAAYAALYRGNLEEARALAARHAEHAVDRWRNRFAGALSILDEAIDGQSRVVDPEDRSEQQAQLASSEPSLEVELSGRTIRIGHKNLSECVVNYYRMDIELLFSRQPFVQQASERFSMIRPGRTDRIELSGDGLVEVPLPDVFHRENVIVEVVAGPLERTVASYAHDLSVQIAEAYGHVYVRARESDRPLAATYVKVYARMPHGAVEFYKDGYTDVRGCFDYTSLSTNQLDRVERFALLILSEEEGAVIREARPPLSS